jgi:ribokinase
MGGTNFESDRATVMTNIVVIGYASIDYPAVLDGFFKGDQTVMIKQRPADAFPRPGGCPLYVAQPLVSESNKVSIVSWVGDDNLGEFFQTSVADAGVDAKGIATIESGSTPICFMIYQDDGSCGCCFDPGMLGREVLSEHQINLIREADFLCITVGPSEIGQRALSLASDSCKVAWVAKNDPLSYPVGFRAQLGARADYIFCNQVEREWIDEALANRERSAPLVVQTGGANAIQIQQDSERRAVSVEPIVFNDASGAGDTLAGGCLKALADGDIDLQSIARSGIQSAAGLLQSRSSEDL